MRTLVSFGFGLWLLGFGIALGQPADSQRIRRIRAWVSAVALHVPGQSDAAVEQVRTWSAAELVDLRDHIRSVLRLMLDANAASFRREGETVVREPLGYSQIELEALRAIARDVASRWDGNQLLRRGTLLHTDIALRAPPRAQSQSGTGGDLQQRTLFVADGRTVNQDVAADHWELARSLLELVSIDSAGRKREPRGDPFVRLWYGTVARFMLRSGKLWVPHFERARELFPRDPDLLFLEGALHETFAAPRIQDAVQELRPAVGVGGRTYYYETAVRSERTELREAESLLRRALTIDPSRVEARIRLGRVLTLLDRPADAVSMLKGATTTASEPLLRYYSMLFLGRAAEQTGDLILSRQSYETAATLYPRAQSPRLALSQLAQLSAAPSRSMAETNEVLTRDSTREDPWWSYHDSVGRDADVKFEQLLDVLRAGDRR
jgi:hypothetical protein